MDFSLVEASNRVFDGPMSSVVLGDPRFIYVPLWDTGADEVYAYRCTPLWQGTSGAFEPIEAFGDAFADPAERLSVDIAVFDKAIGHLNRIVAQYGIAKILIPVHMSTLMDEESRSLYLSECGGSVWSVYDNICFEIVEVGADVTADTLATAIEVIRPYGSQLFVCLDSNEVDLVPQNPEQRPLVIGRNARRIGGQLDQVLQEFGANAADRKIGSYVHGIVPVETTASAIAAGFAYIGSEAIAPALDEPDQPVAIEETARMLRTLMTGKRQS